MLLLLAQLARLLLHALLLLRLLVLAHLLLLKV
jgi:hypothetical protein